MNTKLIILTALLLTMGSCRESYKTCTVKIRDDELQLYNDILNELVVHRFGGYLNIPEGLWEAYGGYSMDSASYEDFEQEIIKLHNKMFNDTSQFVLICFKQELNSSTPAYYRDDLQMSESLWVKAKQWLDNSSLNWHSVLDSLSASQTKYVADDFQLCTAKVIPHTKGLNGCDIGYVSFSKVVMNVDQTKAILYFEFRCGSKCGFGDMLMVEKTGIRWTISNTIDLWI